MSISNSSELYKRIRNLNELFDTDVSYRNDAVRRITRLYGWVIKQNNIEFLRILLDEQNWGGFYYIYPEKHFCNILQMGAKGNIETFRFIYNEYSNYRGNSLTYKELVESARDNPDKAVGNFIAQLEKFAHIEVPTKFNLLSRYELSPEEEKRAILKEWEELTGVKIDYEEYFYDADQE